VHHPWASQAERRLGRGEILEGVIFLFWIKCFKFDLISFSLVEFQLVLFDLCLGSLRLPGQGAAWTSQSGHC
jgi:hypothetical protein